MNKKALHFATKYDTQILHCTVRDKRSQRGQRDVFIPRIALYPKSIEQFGFEWTRLQFPVCAAFAMTINASQANSFSSNKLCVKLYNAGADYEEGGSLAGGRPSIFTWTAVCGSFKVNKYCKS